MIPPATGDPFAAGGDKTHWWRKVRQIFAEVTEAPPSQQGDLLRALTEEEDPAVAEEVRSLLALQEEERVLTLDATAPRIASGGRRPGMVLAERYRLERFIASGGMGDVFAATDLSTGRAVAIKMIRPFSALESDAEARLLREAKLAGRIEHPNVCRMLAIDTHRSERFCVMELLEGETLAERLRREGPLPLALAEDLALQLCDGLAAAHDSGVLHRDIKPGNIFLTDDERRVVLIDFGLAAASAAWEHTRSLTSAGAVIGTLAYVAPEQLEGRDATQASDVYSLGVVLHEMLTGRKPHSANSPFRLARQKVSESHHRSLAGIPGLPPVWAEVLTRCLRANPRSRYASAGAVRAALQRKSPSLGYLVSRNLVRIPLGLALSIAGGFALWQFVHSDYQPRAEALPVYHEAEIAIREAAPRHAAALLERALALDPNFLKARAMLAIAHTDMDQMDQARQDIVQATLLSDRRWLLGRKERHAVHATRAVVMRDFASAAEHFRLWSRSAAGQEQVYATIATGRWLEQAGRPEAALETLERAVQMDPSHPAARVRLAVLLCHAQQFDRARREFETVASAFRRERNLEGLAGVLLARSAGLRNRPLDEDQNDLDEAFAVGSAAGNRYQALLARFRMASLAIRRRDYDNAAIIARETAAQARLEALDGLAAQAMGEFGNALVYASRPGQAVPILQDAVAMARKSGSEFTLALNAVRLGEALTQLQRSDEAREVMRPAIEWYRQNGFASDLAHALIKFGTAHAELEQRLPIFEEALALARRTSEALFESMALQRIVTDLSIVNLRRASEYGHSLLPMARLSNNHGAMLRTAEIWRDFGQPSEQVLAVVHDVESLVRNYPPGLDRDRLQAFARLVTAEHHLVQGWCAQGLREVGQVSPEVPPSLRPHHEVVRWRLEACLGTPAVARSSLERILLRRDGQQDPRFFLAQGEAALALGRPDLAREFALQGLEKAQRAQSLVQELPLLLILRASSGTGAARHPGEERVLALARRVGFDPPEQFGGRHDLLRLWNAGLPSPLQAARRTQ